MASRVNSRSLLKKIASAPALRFIHPALVVDWIVVFSLSLLGHYIERQPVFQRNVAHYLTPFPDPSISYEHHFVERVPANPNGMLDQITFYAPIGIFILVGGALRWSLHDVHNAVLGLWTSRELMRVTVEFIKNRVGRLRPDFLSRCAWSVVEQACTGPPGLVKDGRRSFPSGHSSTAWQGMLFLVLYLAGKNGAFAYFRPPHASLAPLPTPRPSRVPAIIRQLLSSHLLRLIVALAPLSLAVWIPITRIEDNYHHYQDFRSLSLSPAYPVSRVDICRSLPVRLSARCAPWPGTCCTSLRRGGLALRRKSWRGGGASRGWCTGRGRRRTIRRGGSGCWRRMRRRRLERRSEGEQKEAE